MACGHDTKPVIQRKLSLSKKARYTHNISVHNRQNPSHDLKPCYSPPRGEERNGYNPTKPSQASPSQQKYAFKRGSTHILTYAQFKDLETTSCRQHLPTAWQHSTNTRGIQHSLKNKMAAMAIKKLLTPNPQKNTHNMLPPSSKTKDKMGENCEPESSTQPGRFEQSAPQI